jgi:hypothetical protein
MPTRGGKGDTAPTDTNGQRMVIVAALRRTRIRKDDKGDHRR